MRNDSKNFAIPMRHHNRYCFRFYLAAIIECFIEHGAHTLDVAVDRCIRLSAASLDFARQDVIGLLHYRWYTHIITGMREPENVVYSKSIYYD